MQSALVQRRPLEELAAVGGMHADLERAALAADRERDRDAGLAKPPDTAEQPRKAAHGGAVHRQHHVALAQARLLRWAAGSDAQESHAAADLRDIDAEPRPRRPAGSADGGEVVEDRLQKIDWHDHVGIVALALPARQRPARLHAYRLNLQRADAQQLAVRTDHRSAAPERVRRSGID